MPRQWKNLKLKRGSVGADLVALNAYARRECGYNNLKNTIMLNNDIEELSDEDFINWCE